MVTPGRSYSSGTLYRYGFNGQEKSDDVTAGNYTAEYWEYDSRIGRRWNIDPKPAIGQSYYAVFRNNPLCYFDQNGDTTYHTTKDGKLIDVDKTGGGIWIATGEYKKYSWKERTGGTNKHPKYSERCVDIFVTENLYQVNDASTDVKQLEAMKTGDKVLTFVSDENINWIMKNSDIYPRNYFSRNEFAYSQSVGGKLDFNYRYTLPSQGIAPEGEDASVYDYIGGFMIMGDPNKASIAYNLNDAGQWLWGQAMMRLGFGAGTAMQGANLESKAVGHGTDTRADQSAIGQGFIYNVGKAALSQGIFPKPTFASTRDNRKHGERKTDRAIIFRF